MTTLNSRIIRVGIESQDGDFMFFEDLDIRCTGEKWAGPESSACRIQLSNLTRDQKNFILTTASPMKLSGVSTRRPLLVTIDVGRENVFDPFRLFQGYCYASYVTMPPDIGIVLESTVQSLDNSITMGVSMGSVSELQVIAHQIADFYKLNLKIDADQKTKTKRVANFAYNCGLGEALNKLSMTSLLTVFVDNQVMYVVDKGKPVSGKVFELNVSTGMVGIPEVCESGVNARCLITPEMQLGGKVKVTSSINPAANGDYLCYNVKYEVANREDPFWYNMFLVNPNYTVGVQ